MTLIYGGNVLRRMIMRTIMTLTLASSASGQARNVANTESVQTQAAQTQLAARPIPPEMTQRFQTLHSALQPPASAWIEHQAHLMAQQPSPDMPALEAAIRNRFSSPKPGRELSSNQTAGNPVMLGGIQGADIEAVAFIVLMEASKDASDDLQKIMQDVQKRNQQKQALRQLLEDMNRLKSQSPNGQLATPCASPACQSLLAQLRQFSTASGPLPRPIRLPAGNSLTYGDINQLLQQTQQNLDSMSETSEMDSLRLQMAMDRRSKLLDALSNVMKKISDTSAAIVGNLK